jgi:hypothetical protein
MLTLPQDPNFGWPPVEVAELYLQIMEWDAWLSGSPLRLVDYYSSILQGTPPVGAMDSETWWAAQMALKQPYFVTARRNSALPRGQFWAQELGNERRLMVHVPIAGEIASTSATFLFGEHPKVIIPEAHLEKPDSEAQKTEARLQAIISKTGVFATLLEAAELCSGLGGIYLKVNWDKGLSEYPILSVAQPDRAVPEFKHGMLSSVIFWKVIGETENNKVMRLLELHTPGKIETSIYVGTSDRLGTALVLNKVPGYEDTPELIETGLDGLACVYIPNTKPNRLWRGSQVGQADYSGSEGLMDALDEAMTSLVRDIQLGKGRIIAPESYFQQKDGKRAFDLEREAYVSLHAPSTPGGAKDDIINVQFDIRSQPHLDAIKEIKASIVTSARYSPQTFGVNIQGLAESGTALNIRERQSLMTTAKKAEYWRPKLEYLFWAMINIDALHLQSGVTPYRAAVEMQDSVRADITELAPCVQQISTSGAASKEVLVGILHPDWEADQIKAEIEKIKADEPPMPDIFNKGGGLPGEEEAPD